MEKSIFRFKTLKTLPIKDLKTKVVQYFIIHTK